MLTIVDPTAPASDPDPPIATSRGLGWGDVLCVDRYPTREHFELKQAGLDHHCVTYMLSQGRLSQNRAGRVVTSLLRRDSMLIRPAHQEASWMGHRPAHVRLRLSKTSLNATWLELGSQPSRAPELLTVFSDHDQFVSRIALVLLHELQQAPHPSQRMIVDSAGAMLAAHLVRQYCSFSKNKQRSQPRLSPHCLQLVCRFVEEADVHSAIDLQTLAGICSLSPFHFARAFRGSIGMTPMQFVEESRLNRAIELMRQGHLRVSQIATAVGYSDAGYFARRFTAFTHRTPSVYMRSLRTQISVPNKYGGGQ